MPVRVKKRPEQEVEDNWNGTWREILENPDGSINVAQLKLELMDFSDMIDRMSHLTCEVTRNRLSYPTYEVDTILGVMNEIEEEEREEQKEEDQQDGQCSLCGHEFESDDN